MNQILSTSNDYNNNYNKNETRRIIVVFAILVIIIAIAIIAVALYSSKANKKASGSTIDISIIKNTDKKEATINVQCEDGISYIAYAWNENKQNKVELNGSKTFNRIISIPELENNTLLIEAVSVNGIKAQKTENIQMNVDSNKPKIDEMTVLGSNLHIKASDDNGISYLTYQWEDEAEKTIMADSEDNKTITADISIKRGTYKLTVKVFDISGNKEETSKLITGVNQPEITVIKYGNKVNVTVTHDMGFKRIEYLANNKLYVYDENYSEYDAETTTIELDLPLQEGENIIQVTAYSLEKLEEDAGDELDNYAYKIFAGKCTYEIVE